MQLMCQKFLTVQFHMPEMLLRKVLMEVKTQHSNQGTLNGPGWIHWALRDKSNGSYLTIENFDTETLYSSRKIITDNGFSLYESRAYGSISFISQLKIYSALSKRLLGAKRELREMSFKVFGAKRLLGPDSALAPRSLLARLLSRYNIIRISI